MLATLQQVLRVTEADQVKHTVTVNVGRLVRALGAISQELEPQVKFVSRGATGRRISEAS
jgi:hypothetical protein